MFGRKILHQCSGWKWDGSWWCSLWRQADESTSLVFDWPPSLHLAYSLICHHTCMPLTLTLKIEATSFFEILISTYQTTLSQLTPQSVKSELWKPKTSTKATETLNHNTYILSALWNYSQNVSFQNFIRSIITWNSWEVIMNSIMWAKHLFHHWNCIN